MTNTTSSFTRTPSSFNKKLFVTVIGGGNSTAIFACLAKLAGHDVAILTRKPASWSSKVLGACCVFMDYHTNFFFRLDLRIKTLGILVE
jgi:2-polyprenyl-6-methoxyphenol hydroxylase-like FAD-dependent oxidoreductase